jgi:hypothetical protein
MMRKTGILFRFMPPILPRCFYAITRSYNSSIDHGWLAIPLRDTSALVFLAKSAIKP